MNGEAFAYFRWHSTRWPGAHPCRYNESWKCWHSWHFKDWR